MQKRATSEGSAAGEHLDATGPLTHPGLLKHEHLSGDEGVTHL